jgi:hypothetical protein
VAERESDKLSVLAIHRRPPVIKDVPSIKDFSSPLFAAVYIRAPQAVLVLGTELGTGLGDEHGQADSA